MQTMAERVYEIVRSLPEPKAAKVLRFAESVQADTEPDDHDFFALAGLWEGRDIELSSLRKKAWPEHCP